MARTFYFSFFNLKLAATYTFACTVSIPTVDYVESCPETEMDLEKASRKKNCESIALLQNCTDNKKFKYHCVLNSLKNATLEVCAEEIISQGKLTIHHLYVSYYD